MAALEVEVTAAAAVGWEATAEPAEKAAMVAVGLAAVAMAAVATGAGPDTLGAAPSFRRKQSCDPYRCRTERSM